MSFGERFCGAPPAARNGMNASDGIARTSAGGAVKASNSGTLRQLQRSGRSGMIGSHSRAA